MYTILIVEDDRTIARAVQKHLESWGMKACIAEDFQNVTAEFLRCGPQLVLLDIYLPFYNGHHWCSEIRKLSRVPIVFLSSAADNMNIVMAMNMGGNDFITKPFDLSVLTAKVQALLRRTYEFTGAADRIEHGGALLDLGELTLQAGDTRIPLTKNEFRILQLLFERRGRTVPREDIMQALWESDSFIDDNTLTVNVARLRAHLAEIGLEGFIRTQKGLGYLVDET